jgi:hypothetical protein
MLLQLQMLPLADLKMMPVHITVVDSVLTATSPVKTQNSVAASYLRRVTF